MPSVKTVFSPAHWVKVNLKSETKMLYVFVLFATSMKRKVSLLFLFKNEKLSLDL